MTRSFRVAWAPSTRHMVTNRLDLVAATLAMCDAEGQGPDAIARELDATVPPSWPPPVFERDDVERIRAQLTADPTVGTWTLHYVVCREPARAAGPALVGVAGYGGPPTSNGVVEIGYAIAEEYQRRGYATEAVEALLSRAFGDPRVRTVVATTYVALQASIRVLQKTGFVEVSRSAETGLMRFECVRANAVQF